MEKITYEKIYNMSNLLLAWRKARKGKTKKKYVKEFEKDTLGNLFKLHSELKNQTYQPKPLITFILRDPKTRKISKADFRDRVVHHALFRIIESSFDKNFIYDSCANRKGKGNLFALREFERFIKKVTKNFHSEAFCLKADIKHYFQEVDHEILISLLKRKIDDECVMTLIKKILENGKEIEGKGMPLGNLTSQFFANVYLNKLDKFVKHKLKARFYIRYVDDFVILHKSKEQLEIWKRKIREFLNGELKLALHRDKSKIIFIPRGVDFVGFRIFYHFKLLRKRNIKNMKRKIQQFINREISEEKILESFQGWNAYARWANSYNLRKQIFQPKCLNLQYTSKIYG